MKRTVRFLAGLLLAMTALSHCVPAAAGPAGPTLPNPPTFTYPPTRTTGDSERKIDVEGMERTYLLHVPPGLYHTSLVPLVLVFHGHRMNAEYLLAMTGFNGIADTERFLVAYPNGTGSAGALSFNAGLCCGSAEQDNIDETAFVNGILADLEDEFAIDPARVYLAGFSNGAMLAYRLACEMSDTFAAIAPVAGNILFAPCRPRQKVSVIHVQGLSDASIPFEDADLLPDSDPAILSVKGSIAFWAAFDGCADFPYEEQNGIVTHASYSACTSGTAVELYTLKGVGHVWPPKTLWPASRTIWDFFAAHPRQ